jgi:hypothetical protein
MEVREPRPGPSVRSKGSLPNHMLFKTGLEEANGVGFKRPGARRTNNAVGILGAGNGDRTATTDLGALGDESAQRQEPCRGETGGTNGNPDGGNTKPATQGESQVEAAVGQILWCAWFFAVISS